MRLGIIGGTSLLKRPELTGGERRRVVTIHGSCELVRLGENVVYLPRHGLDRHTPPHRLNHHAHLEALRRVGVERIVALGSVGSLHKEVPPGTLMLADDTFAPLRVVTFHHDELQYTVPGFDPAWRRQVHEALVGAGIDVRDGGTYAETLGPRFETPAEIRWLAGAADVVGMTCASEAALAREREIPFSLLAVVDNYAHGVAAEPLTAEQFQATVKANEDTVWKALNALMALVK